MGLQVTAAVQDVPWNLAGRAHLAQARAALICAKLDAVMALCRTRRTATMVILCMGTAVQQHALWSEAGPVQDRRCMVHRVSAPHSAATASSRVPRNVTMEIPSRATAVPPIARSKTHSGNTGVARHD